MLIRLGDGDNDDEKDDEGLKEQCHEGFVLFGQFCAKILTLRLSVKLRRRYQMNIIREG